MSIINIGPDDDSMYNEIDALDAGQCYCDDSCDPMACCTCPTETCCQVVDDGPKVGEWWWCIDNRSWAIAVLVKSVSPMGIVALNPNGYQMLPRDSFHSRLDTREHEEMMLRKEQSRPLPGIFARLWRWAFGE